MTDSMYCTRHWKHSIMETNCAMAEKIFRALSEVAEFFSVDVNTCVLFVLKLQTLRCGCSCMSLLVNNSFHSPPPPPSPTRGLFPPCSLWVAHSACSVYPYGGVYGNYVREVICHLQGQGSNKVSQKVHPVFLVINRTSTQLGLSHWLAQLSRCVCP